MPFPLRSATRQSLQALAFMALVVGAVAVGASAIFVRLSELGALPSAFYRPFLALPFLYAWLRTLPSSGAKDRPQSWGEAARLVFAGALFAGDLAFWHLSLHHTTVANATLFANMAPVLVVLAERFLYRQRVPRVFLIGLALALTGAVILLGGSFDIDPGNLVGDGFGIVTAFFLAGYLMAVARLRKTFSTGAIMLWTSTGTAAVLLPVALATGEPMVAQTPFGWLMLFALAVVSHAGGQGLIAYALAHLPASLAAAGLLLEPLAAAALAVAILGEPLTAWQIIGGGIILWGVLIARRGYA